MEQLTYPPASVTPRTFFVPGASDTAMAEEAWHGLRSSSGFAATDRRVQRIQYNHRGVYTTEVGYLENDDEFEWLTTAIFEPAEPSMDDLDHAHRRRSAGVEGPANFGWIV